VWYYTTSSNIPPPRFFFAYFSTVKQQTTTNNNNDHFQSTPKKMRKIPPEHWMLYGMTLLVVVVGTYLLHHVPRTLGRKPVFHVIFLLAAVVSLLTIPGWVQKELFSPGGVILIGTIVPIYETIVAVCSVDVADDRAWLQFWVANAIFSFSTEFVDEITAYLPSAGEHWYEFEFFMTLWLVLPMTDGAGLVYEYVTRPLLAPAAHVLQKRLEGYIGALLTLVNATHLWITWFVFVSLPEDARRFVVVAIGVVYPTVASMAAISVTPTKHNDTERFWLTYWASYSILFIAMDYLENFVGHIRGFYTICGVATLYLFLPMFKGADVVFRRILVPLTGQYENMLLQDAYRVKLALEDALPSREHERVMKKAAQLFVDAKKDQ
jgi:receptor expression-enhancing protein 5/6